jgi:hypothetical protein
MKRRIGWSGLINLLVVPGIVGVTAAQQPKPGGTLRVACETVVTGLDHRLSLGIQAYDVKGNLFNRKPSFLRPITRDRDGDQSLNLPSA